MMKQALQFAALATAATFAFAVDPAAAGVQIPQAPPLTGFPAAISQLIYTSYSNQAGTVTVTDNVWNPTATTFETGFSTVSVAPDPSITMHLQQLDNPLGGGDDSVTSLAYYVQWNAPVGTPAAYLTFTASDTLSYTGQASAYVYVRVSSYYGVNTPLAVEDCAGPTHDCYGGVATAPLSSITSLLLAPNQPYRVYLEAGLNVGAAGGSADSATAILDPRISLPNGVPGTLSYSPTVAVPEPAAWSLMLSGLALTGGLARRRRSADVRSAIIT